MTNSNMELQSVDGSETHKTETISAEDVSLSNSQVILDEKEQAGVRPTKKDLEVAPSISELPQKEMSRVLLWTAPRSLSTAFERCMTRVPNAKIFNEMYGAAFLLGPDRKKWFFPKLTPKHSYKHCKERMEADHPGHEFVFAKDFAFEMHKHCEMLPKGFQHTFLVRHPYKVFTSLRKMLCNSVILRTLSLNAKIKICFPTDGYFYEDMWELYSYIKARPDDFPAPIIIDADDLVADPDAMIMKYCELIGLPFQPEILQWEKAELKELPWEGPKFFHFMNSLIGCYKNALNSTGFRKSGTKKEAKKDAPKNAWEDKDKTKSKKSSGNKVNASSSKSSICVDSDIVDKNDAIEATIEGSGKSTEGVRNDGFDAGSASDSESLQNDGEKDAPLCKISADSSTVHEYDLSSVHSDVRKAVEYTMPFYKLLHKEKITLNTNN